MSDGRFLAAVTAAAIFYFAADGLIHGRFLAEGHRAAITGAGKEVREDPRSFLYFGAFDLGKAALVALLYVLLTARIENGWAAGAAAGLVAWLAIELLPNLSNMPFPFYPPSFYWKWIALELVPMIAGGLLVRWIHPHP